MHRLNSFSETKRVDPALKIIHLLHNQIYIHRRVSVFVRLGASASDGGDGGE